LPRQVADWKASDAWQPNLKEKLRARPETTGAATRRAAH
jgi:hypothetical protein